MPENDYIGRVLDKKYKVSRRLGDSGMGVVYLGESMETGTWVAIKFLRSELVKRKESLKRFFREARATVQLRHKNIIKIYDIGITDEGEPYLVMEYIEGESLSDLLSRVGKLEPMAAVAIIEPVLRAVGSMHKKGILHRGIKPENIYLVHRQGAPPKVKLTDFGLSKFTENNEGGELTIAGITLGDFSYISPEQIRDSSSVDHRADLYSIATIMYEMLTGKLPFADHAEENQLSAKFTSAPAAPRQIVPSIPPAMESLIMRALKTELDGRPATADEMLYTIEGLKGFKKRADKLGKATEGASRLTIAGGNFEVPSTMRNAAASPPSSPGAGRKKISFDQARSWILGTMYGRVVGGAAVLGVVSLLLVIVLGHDDSESEQPMANAPLRTAPQPESAPKDEKPNEVQIEVRGVPSGAKIYYDGAPIPLNPFRVALKEIIVPLKIEADGYETYATSVVPAEDQVVKVVMKPSAPKEATDTEERDAVPLEKLRADMESETVTESAEPKAASPKNTGPANRGGKSSGRQRNKDDDDFVKLRDGVKVSGEFD